MKKHYSNNFKYYKVVKRKTSKNISYVVIGYTDFISMIFNLGGSEHSSLNESLEDAKEQIKHLSQSYILEEKTVYKKKVK